MCVSEMDYIVPSPYVLAGFTKLCKGKNCTKEDQLVWIEGSRYLCSTYFSEDGKCQLRLLWNNNHHINVQSFFDAPTADS